MAERRRYEAIEIRPDRDYPGTEKLQLDFRGSQMINTINLEPADLLELQRVVDAKVTELDGSQG